MKAIKILAVLALVMFVVEVLGDAATGFMREREDFQEQVEKREHEHRKETCTLQLKAVRGEQAVDSIHNKSGQMFLPYTVESITIENVTPPTWSWILMVLSVPFTLFFLFGIYCVGRLIVSVLRGSIFTKRNVSRMRYFVYSLLVFGILMELHQWILYQSVAPQITLEGYEVASYSLTGAWFGYIMLALFTEIFAVGVKLKEEQDLTI